MLIPKTKQEKDQFISALRKLNEFLLAKGEGEIPKADIETNVYDFVDAIETMDERWLDELPDEVINMYNHLVSDELAESEQEEAQVEAETEVEAEAEVEVGTGAVEVGGEVESPKKESKKPEKVVEKEKPKRRSKFEVVVEALKSKSPCTMDELLEEAERRWGKKTTDMKWYINGVLVVLRCVGMLEEANGKFVLKNEGV